MLVPLALQTLPELALAALKGQVRFSAELMPGQLCVQLKAQGGQMDFLSWDSFGPWALALGGLQTESAPGSPLSTGTRNLYLASE